MVVGEKYLSDEHGSLLSGCPSNRLIDWSVYFIFAQHNNPVGRLNHTAAAVYVAGCIGMIHKGHGTHAFGVGKKPRLLTERSWSISSEALSDKYFRRFRRW